MVDETRYRLQKALDIRGISPKELSDKTGISKSSISQYMSGYAKPKQDRIYLISKALNINPVWLLGYDVSMEIKEPTTEEKKPHPLPRVHEGVRIPVYGSIPCGVPIEAIDDITDWEDIPKEWCTGDKEFFALVTKGDSMYPKYIEGDVVIVQKQEDFSSGDDCVVYINSDYEATLKTLYKLKEGIQVKPFNPSYTPRTYSWKEVEALPISIAGVVVELRRKVK